jgi:hypothetical protein
VMASAACGVAVCATPRRTADSSVEATVMIMTSH